MALWRIPTRPYPTFTQTTDLDGTTYSLRFRWSERGGCWHLDMRTLDGVPVLLSARLVTHWPLLRRVRNAVRPPGELFVQDLTGPGEEPTLEEFGSRFVLFYLDAEELGLA
jgi:hypothetical protein